MAHSLWRACLILGRVSNLPTVWSNCLAGFLLGGGGSLSRWLVLCCGATALYLGGMFLNDAFDADFDQRFRPERPIPSQAIARTLVWKLGFGAIASGLFLLSFLGGTVLLLAVGLVLCILLYDAVHKVFTLSPVLMAGCRAFLLLVASAAGQDGITGWSLWSAVVLAAYVVGLSYVARTESAGAPRHYWATIFLTAPLFLALIVDRGAFQTRGTFLCALVSLWMVLCLRHIFFSRVRHPGRCVSGLLAGIVLVDLLAIAALPPAAGAILLVFFILALLGQRFVPAT